jgi:cytochrome bd-type quinol oxidase subunit 2
MLSFSLIILMLFIFLDTFKIGVGSRVTTHDAEVRVLCAYI